MNKESIAAEIRRALPDMKLRADEEMKKHCSFRIGGPAELFAEPSGEAELAELLQLLRGMGEEPLIIGRGTNLLVADGGVPGVVIKLGEGMSRMEAEGETIYAESGVSLAALALFAQRRGLSGLEFAHGIPGSLGGAVYMNAGAYGGEMKDVVSRVRYIDRGGEIKETEDCGFSYRHSVFEDSGCVILGAWLKLSAGEAESIMARMRELMEKRSSSQPLDKPSGGSTFKRPVGGYAAAMIDGAGLKGCSIGGAQVSEKHAGFVINAGDASCADVLALMEHIQKEVKKVYGVELEPEVRLIGC